jgi:DNA (cytosine-5)-methyltransferase 1
VLENVAALLSRGLDTILWDLAEIGYDAEWHCIPASAVGAPHRRDRIWIIAHARSEQHEGRSPTFSGALAEELLAKDTDAAGERCGEAGQLRYVESPEWSPGLCEDVADAESECRDGCWCGTEPARRRELADGGSEMADATSSGQQRPRDVQGEGGQAGQPICSTWWAVEPDVGRVAHGVPARVDRLTRLGNSVVPQIPEIIGRAIMTVSDMTNNRT